MHFLVLILAAVLSDKLALADVDLDRDELLIELPLLIHARQEHVFFICHIQ